jgi:hypothetical protein
MKAQDIKTNAQHIFEDVLRMQTEFTHDNTLSKFFPPEQINEASYIISGALATTLYPSSISFEKIKGSSLHMLFYLAILLGFNTYLKERSYTVDAPPFTYLEDKKNIDTIREELFQKATQGALDATPLGEAAITKFYNHLLSSRSTENFTIDDHEIIPTNFEKYLGVILYWGYNFAQETIIEQS